MKKFAYIILSIVVVSVLASSPALAEPKKAEASQTAETKITRDAAQQLVMKKYLGAKVISCNFRVAKGGEPILVTIIWLSGAFRKTTQGDRYGRHGKREKSAEPSK